VSESFREYMELVGTAVDGLGVVVIVAGILFAAWRLTVRRPRHVEGAFNAFRQDIGRSILLGLEFLVAGDIIRTVAVAPTLDNVLALGVIVLIRTFLSMSLQVELEGRWPWQQHRAGHPPGEGPARGAAR